MYLEFINLLQCLDAFMAIFGLLLIGSIPRFNALVLLLVLQLLQATFNFLEETGISRSYYLVTPVFTLGFGPAIYLFCYQLVYTHLPDRFWRHFFPLLLCIPLTQWPQVVIALGSLSQLLYLTAAMLLLKRYERVTAQARSDAANLSLRWMTIVLSLFLIMMAQDLIRLNLQPHLPADIRNSWYFINSSIYFLLNGYLIIMAVRQPHLFNDFSEFTYLEFADKAKATEQSTNPDETSINLFNQIDSLIGQHELFKQPRFSLRDLATASGLNEKLLSSLINQQAGKNFNDYINKLRVDAICQHLIQHPEDGQILNIALDMGFNAKSTFNTAFKKETGLTPSQFVKQHHNKVQNHDSGRETAK